MNTLMKKSCIIVVRALCVASLIIAEPSINDMISEMPSDKVEAFLSGDTIEMYSLLGECVPSIAMDGSMGKSKANKDYGKEDAFTLGLSTFIEYPESWKNMSFEEKKLRIINTFLSISTIKGITYISHTAGEKPKVLFSDAYTLVDKDSKKEAYDVEFSYAPTSYKYQVAAYLKDSIFGGNKYLVDYDISESEIFMTITNYTDLKFLFYKAVAKGELNMCVDAVMTKEGIAIFALATVFGQESSIQTPFGSIHLPSAFMKRITSLKNWFIQEINK